MAGAVITIQTATKRPLLLSAAGGEFVSMGEDTQWGAR